MLNWHKNKVAYEEEMRKEEQNALAKGGVDAKTAKQQAEDELDAMMIQGDGKKVSAMVAFKRALKVKINKLISDNSKWREFRSMINQIKKTELNVPVSGEVTFSIPRIFLFLDILEIRNGIIAKFGSSLYVW